MKYRYVLITVLLLLTSYIMLIPRSLFDDPVSTVILDSDGNPLGARVAGDGQWRFPVSGYVPDKISLATLAFEDRFFYFHPGINPVSLFRAIFMNLKAGEELIKRFETVEP